MAFQQQRTPRYQPGPQDPTANNFQIAGEAMQQGGATVSRYASIFEKMVEDRKATVIQQQQLERQAEKDQRQTDEYNRIETERKEKEARDDATWDKIEEIQNNLELTPEQKKIALGQLQTRNIRTGTPGDYLAGELNPAIKEAQRVKEQQEKHQNKLEEIRLRNRGKVGKGKSKELEKRYKGFNQAQTSKLKAVDSGAVPLESQQKQVFAEMEELNLKLKQLENSDNSTSKARYKALMGRYQKAHEFWDTIQNWKPLNQESTGPTGTVTPEMQQNLEVLNSQVGSLNPQQQAVLQAINENPTDPRAIAALSKLKSELANGLNP